MTSHSNSSQNIFLDERESAQEQIARSTAIVQGRLAELKAGKSHWRGELASSALSTATAVSALAIVRDGPLKFRDPASELPTLQQHSQSSHDNLINRGIRYLIDTQNADGGWGDTDRSLSNVATSLLAISAIHLARRDKDFAEVLQKAWAYVDSLGRWEALTKRYGKDKTFAVPILTNCALAGLVEWRDVPALPFEAAALPQAWYRFIQLPVVSYAIPALVAIGQVREHFAPLRNPLRWPLRKLAVKPSLKVLRRMQPASGGYLEAIPLTSFVLMSLAAKGLRDSAIAADAINFLESTVRDDGSWPIDSDLATWVTSLAATASLRSDDSSVVDLETIRWLCSCQHQQRHPFTGASPGGWGWTDLSGAVPDADDTPAALIALYYWIKSNRPSDTVGEEIAQVVGRAIPWLLGLQNRDGGWPTFCRGWGTLPFDRSGSDLTAHAIRALHLWSDDQAFAAVDWPGTSELAAKSLTKIKKAIERGRSYLRQRQAKNGSWLPLWFGNQDDPNEENPIYGTARVLVAMADCGWQNDEEAIRGLEFLKKSQNPDGGWGGGASISYSPKMEVDRNKTNSPAAITSTVEETSQALEAIARLSNASDGSFLRGIAWLNDAVVNSWHEYPQPIGFYFAKLWYFEQMYPLVYSLSALNAAREVLRSAEMH